MKKLFNKLFFFKILNYIYINSKIKYYKRNLKKVGKNFSLYGNVHIENEGNIEIGDNVAINEGVILNAISSIKIGNNSVISAYSQLQTAGLEIGNIESKKHLSNEIIIGDNVWICANCILLGGINVGNNSVIASCSLVNKDIPENQLWGGIPAKKIKDI